MAIKIETTNMSREQQCGFSKNATTGVLYLIGIGDEAWLRARLHHGCNELVMRDVLPGEADFEPPVERDLSGGSLYN